MGRVLPIVILALLVLYCLVEVAQADPERVRTAPRWLWAVAVICLPGAGAIAWLIFGRPVKGGQPDRDAPAPRAPDDDPDFLRRLR